MLKKTLHSAVAAIAVSTMFLPVAEAAKKDLVLDFGSYTQHMVHKNVMVFEDGTEESVRATLGDGIYEFENKTLSANTAVHIGARDPVSGQHAACDAGSDLFLPLEMNIILRGNTLSNSLTLDTVSMEDSKDLSNPYASGVCLGSGQAGSVVVNLQISDATGKWSCAYTQGDGISYYYDLQNPSSEPPAERPFHYISFRSEDASNYFGTIIIPRSTCQQ